MSLVDNADSLSIGSSTESEVEHVLGMTVFSNSSLTSNPVSGVVAYPAGSVVVLLDCLKNKQTSSLQSPGKMITAVDFSPDGKLLLTGESGHGALVRVWRTDTMQETASFGQFTGIECLAFTPSMREIIVIGNTQDISVWSWPKKVMLSLNKFCDNVYAMSIADDGSFFVTVGNRHMKFYCMDLPNRNLCFSPLPLTARCVALDTLVNNCFCDVVCGKKENKFVFALSSCGTLCQISRSRRLEQWVNVESDGVNCLAIDDSHVFVGCCGGLVQMFDATNLLFITALPLPHPLGLDISRFSEYGGDKKGRHKGKSGACYPGVKALVYDMVFNNLTVIYDDCSIYVWSRTDNTFEKIYSSLFHCGCIWDFSLFPLPKQDVFSDEVPGGALPPGSLITVSSDGTLRSWDVTSNISEDSMLKSAATRNSISSACLKIVYANPPESYHSGKEGGVRQGKLRSSSSPQGHIHGCLSKGGRDTFSVVAVCPEGQHIATGNRHGELCIYDAYSMETLTFLVAHEAEVTALSYAVSLNYKILASGSRDRMIHVMDASNCYRLMSTIDDHSSTITAICFTSIGQYLIMVSSSLDMSVLTRSYTNDKSLTFRYVRAIVEKKAVVDFTVHPWSGQIALVCQDKMVHIHSILSLRDSFSYRGCPSYGGHLVKINSEPSGQYILTACTKRTINLIEFDTGEILKTFSGHAESVTRVQFSLNMKYVISSSSDGCIFFWKLPVAVAYSVKLMMAEMGLLTRGMVLGERWKKTVACGRNSSDTVVVQRQSHDEPHSGLQESRSSSGIGCKSRRSSPSCSSLTPSEYQACASSTSYAGWNAYEPLLSDVWIPPNCNVWKDIPSLDSLTQLFGKDIQGVCLPSNSIHQKLGSGFDTWMTDCCRRRRLFKLEAKSIKRILTMMQLVANAMEKDLQETNISDTRGKWRGQPNIALDMNENWNKAVAMPQDKNTPTTHDRSSTDLSLSLCESSERSEVKTEEADEEENEDTKSFGE